MSGTGLGLLVRHARIIVCTGSGGVGKTTTARSEERRVGKECRL